MSGFLENRFSDDDDDGKLNMDAQYDDYDDSEFDDASDADLDDALDFDEDEDKFTRSSGSTGRRHRQRKLEPAKTRRSGNSKADRERSGKAEKHEKKSEGEQAGKTGRSSKRQEKRDARKNARNKQNAEINDGQDINSSGEPDVSSEFDQARHIVSDQDEAMSEEEAEFLSDIENMMSEETRVAEEHRKAMIQRILQIAVSVGCVYIIMLIFGSLITQYHYGDNGTVEPVVMSVSDIQAKNEYNTLATLYLEARSLYERILILDYRVAGNEEELMAIAPEYEEALDTVSTLATAIEAADLISKYNQVASLLLTWVQTHLAAYCQYMSAAITQNNTSAAEEALAARNVVYSNFQLITENIITLGEDIKVYDLTDIKSWSPEEYVAETVGVQ